MIARNGRLSNKKAETFSLSTEKWSNVADYPHGTFLKGAPIVHNRNLFYVFGGIIDQKAGGPSITDKIISYNQATNKWNPAGSE